jgi:hypothetical protein
LPESQLLTVQAQGQAQAKPTLALAYACFDSISLPLISQQLMFLFC